MAKSYPSSPRGGNRRPPLGRKALADIGVDVTERDSRALASEPLDRRPSDATRAASHEGDAPVEASAHHVIR